MADKDRDTLIQQVAARTQGTRSDPLTQQDIAQVVDAVLQLQQEKQGDDEA